MLIIYPKNKQHKRVQNEEKISSILVYGLKFAFPIIVLNDQYNDSK